jgi:hypothetical protein
LYQEHKNMEIRPVLDELGVLDSFDTPRHSLPSGALTPIRSSQLLSDPLLAASVPDSVSLFLLSTCHSPTHAFIVILSPTINEDIQFTSHTILL